MDATTSSLIQQVRAHQLTNRQLGEQLRKLNLSDRGNKATLESRLLEAIENPKKEIQSSTLSISSNHGVTPHNSSGSTLLSSTIGITSKPLSNTVPLVPNASPSKSITTPLLPSTSVGTLSTSTSSTPSLLTQPINPSVKSFGTVSLAPGPSASANLIYSSSVSKSASPIAGSSLLTSTTLDRSGSVVSVNKTNSGLLTSAPTTPKRANNSKSRSSSQATIEKGLPLPVSFLSTSNLSQQILTGSVPAQGTIFSQQSTSGFLVPISSSTTPFPIKSLNPSTEINTAQSKTVSELRDILKCLGIKGNGTKGDLIERLDAYRRLYTLHTDPFDRPSHRVTKENVGQLIRNSLPGDISTIKTGSKVVLHNRINSELLGYEVSSIQSEPQTGLVCRVNLVSPTGQKHYLQYYKYEENPPEWFLLKEGRRQGKTLYIVDILVNATL